MKKNGFMEGAIIATLAIIFTKIIGVLYVIPFYKIIGSKGGALYGYAYNIYNIFLIISSAGIPLAISKITSEYETKKEYDKKKYMFYLAKKIIIGFSLFAFLTCFIFAKPMAYLILGDLTGGNTIGDVTYVIRCVSFALIIVPMLSISRGYLQGHKFINASSQSQVIEQIVRIIVILLGSYIAVSVLHIPLKYAVGISVMAAAIGALIGFIYLEIKIRKEKMNVKPKKISKADKKEILQKIIGYSIPFIIINIANSIYNTTDMILIIRGLNNLGYSATDIEEISAIFTTWGNKLINIVKAFATGLTISLIPSLVAAYVKKDHKEVNNFFNKALQVLLFVILPITLFMSIFATQIWTIFYGESYYGPLIFKFSILVAVFDSAYVLICSALQGLYKTKLIYKSIFIGLILNLILDLPLIYLFNRLGLEPTYGAITATIIGYSISLGMPLISLYKHDNFRYINTLKLMPKFLLSFVIITSLCFIYRSIMPNKLSLGYNLFYLSIIGAVSLGIYYLMNYKFINELLSDKKKGNK